MGLLCFWVYRTFLSGAVYYGYLALTLVIAAVGVALALKLKQKDGVWTIRGKEIVVLQPGAAYLPYYLTAAVTAILLLAPLALGAAVAYYAMWIVAVYPGGLFHLKIDVKTKTGPIESHSMGPVLFNYGISQPMRRQPVST